MNATHSFEKTDAFFGSEWHGKHAGAVSAAVQPFVTLARESGSGGASLARLLVRELNAHSPAEVCWAVIEGTITTQMLRQHHLSDRLARFLPEDRVSEISSSVGELVGLHPSLWDLVQKTNQTMRRLARQGHVVLVGRGANFATAGLPGGVHVRLLASSEYRARYYAQLYSLSEQEAQAFNVKRDAAARRYVRSTFNADIGAPSAYDLVINMEHVSLAQAAQLVLAQVHARMQSGSGRAETRPPAEPVPLAVGF
jgi:cytidylate kinase